MRLRGRWNGTLALVGALLAVAGLAAPAEAGAATISWDRGGGEIKGTLHLEIAQFFQGNSWFGNARRNLGESSGTWTEGAMVPGLEGTLSLGADGSIYTRISGVGAHTHRTDAAGSNVGFRDGDFRLEDAYVGWRSGATFGSLGEDALDLSIGRRQYVAVTGFLFSGESGNGYGRGGYWIGERNAADLTGIVHLKTGNLEADLVYLKADDVPDTDTRLAGLTLDYSLGEPGSVGGGYYQILHSDLKTRDGMKIYDLRANLTPFSALPGLELQGEVAREDNGDALAATGWYARVAYGLEKLPWLPVLSYRYAAFQGDDPGTRRSEDFDPLFYGLTDWGAWDQGEILGQYVLINSNLNTHQIQLKLEPSETLTVNLIHYDFTVDSPGSFGIRSGNFAKELDLILDWQVNKHWLVSAVGAYADPDEGATEYTGGDDGWWYWMVWGRVKF